MAAAGFAEAGLAAGFAAAADFAAAGFATAGLGAAGFAAARDDVRVLAAALAAAVTPARLVRGAAADDAGVRAPVELVAGVPVALGRALLRAVELVWVVVDRAFPGRGVGTLCEAFS